MREITGHNNDGIKILALDQAESGPPLKYVIEYSIPGGDARSVVVGLTFQDGPMDLFGVNGLSDESLLAILIDRMEGFDNGREACKGTTLALSALRDARRVLGRMAREQGQ